MAFIVVFPGISSISGGIIVENSSELFFRPRSRSGNTARGLRGKKNIGFRFRVCANIKDCDVRVSDFGENIRLSRQFSASVTSPSKRNKEEEEKQNYYVNTGYAIRTLREEFPELFYRELSFDIYRDDVVFKDPLNTFVGIENYKSIFWALRFHGRIFFKALWVDIISVWQPVESVIMIRWTAHGIPRVPWESHGRFDGTSEYKLDKNGKIYEHRVDNIALNSPPKFRVLSVDELIQALGCPSTAKPTLFESSSSPVTKNTQFLMNVTWMRYNLALAITFAWKCAAYARRRIFSP